MSEARLDVTGEWTGIFNYPDPHPPNGFEAVLREVAGTITGETREVSDSAEDVDKIQCAMLDGTRSGHAVTFTKHYDEMHRAANPVRYDGVLSDEGDEITGRWTIPGHWAGTFMMVRAGGRADAVEREAEEELR